MSAGPTFGPIGQLGYAVEDVDAWMANYIAAGIGPWWVYRDMQADVYNYLGQPSAAHFACGISFSGPLMIEVIAPLDQHPSPYLDFLADGGAGLQHVCYFPADIEAATTHLLGAGYAQTVDGHSGGFAYRYFKASGVRESIELGALDTATQARLDDQRAQCRQWDGTDPIRVL